MKSTVFVLAAIATMAAAPEPTQQGRKTPEPTQTLIAPYVLPGPTTPAPDRPYLFKLGSLPARPWAPVPPPYDSHANRNNNSNPLWWETSGF